MSKDLVEDLILEKAKRMAGALLDLVGDNVETAKVLLEEEGARRAELAADLAEKAKFGA